MVEYDRKYELTERQEWAWNKFWQFAEEEKLSIGPQSIKWTRKAAKFTENLLQPDREKDHYCENEV